VFNRAEPGVTIEWFLHHLSLMSHPELVVFFFVIAFIYSSVGFGGGSSYLAILALYPFAFKEMRLTALICNIIVVSGGTIVFLQNKQVNFKKILPLVLSSVPFAFLGATMKISQQTFFIVLGVALIIAAVLLWINTPARSHYETKVGVKPSRVKNSILGGVVGFLSGMVGIGGGIFLSPLLNLAKWDTPRKIAATASLFILMNSLSGIAGQLYGLPADIDWLPIVFLAAAVFVGGQLGSRMGAVKFDQLLIRRITAIVVLLAGIEVLHKHLPWFK
jgi:uncharacterized protein